MKLSQLKESMRNFRRSFKHNWLLFKESKIGLFGLGIIIFFIILALAAPLISDRDPVAWRAPEEDVIGIDRYWVNDLKLAYGDISGNSSMAFVLQRGAGINPQADRIYLGTSNGLFSIRPDTSAEIWTSPLGFSGEISSDVVAVNFAEYFDQPQDYWIFVGDNEGYFYAIQDAAIHSPAPQSALSIKLNSAVTSIAVYNDERNYTRGAQDMIYVGTQEGNLHAFSAVNLTEMWNLTLDGEVHMTSGPMRGEARYPVYSPCLTQDGKTLLVGTGNGTLYSISTITQAILWEWNYDEAGGWSSSPIVGTKEAGVEVVYLGTDDGWLYALYVNNGTEIIEWSDLPYETKGDPLIHGIPVFNLRNEPDAGKLTTPVVIWGGTSGTTIYVGSSSGHFYKINRNQLGTIDDPIYRLPGSTIAEFKEEDVQNINYRFDVQPTFYQLSNLIFVVENHDNGTPQVDDDKGILYALNLNLSVSWRISEDNNIKFSSINSIPIVWTGGGIADSIWFVTSDAVGYSFAASGKYLAPLAPTWSVPLESGNTYWLGTDLIGHDVLSQVAFGTRTALIVGFAAAFFTIIIGMIIGLVSGYFGGRIDSVLMRFTDVVLVIPFLPFIIVLAAVLGPSIWNIIILIALLGWGSVARVIRSEVLSLKERPFIESARVTGASNVRIMFRHIAPNVLPLAFLYMTFIVSSAILTEAALSFIGLGDFTQPSWGIMLYYIQQSNTLSYWWLLWPPGLCIAFLSMGFYLVGRAFEQIVNPRLRRRR
jgi:peptide/nickel transport system permease protein